MLRQVRLALGLLAVLGAAGEARAQWGYGYYPYGYGGYGWGGWGGTVGGDMARGLGVYNVGAGIYNKETAVANSINTDTVMRWNQYWWDAQLTANRAERERLARREARDARSGDYLAAQLRKNPSPGDIASGNALSVLYDDVSDPRLGSSALRQANDKIPAKVIRNLPFVNASEAVTICLGQLTAEEGWPIALRGQEYAAERKAYTDAVQQALKEDREGDLKPESVQAVKDALAKLRAKFQANPPADNASRTQADNYIRTVVGMTRMLARPDVEKVLKELDESRETSLGHLIGFMHTFNLRFAPATTPEQREAYQTLYPILQGYRDRVAKALEANPPATARAGNPQPPTDFLSKMRLNELEGTPPPDPQPAPPQPNLPGTPKR